MTGRDENLGGVPNAHSEPRRLLAIILLPTYNKNHYDKYLDELLINRYDNTA